MNEIMAARFELEVPLAEKSVLCEMSDDYTLPDYMPPIKRVISAEAVVSPPESYVSQTGCELGGNMRYRILYEGGDEGGVWCVELPAEYEATSSLDGGGDNEKCHCRATAAVETPTVRVSAPRRMNIRSRVRMRVAVSSDESFDCTYRGESIPDNEVRCLGGTASAMQTLYGKSEAIALNDSFVVGSDGEQVRVISCRGELNVTNADAKRTGVMCSGELLLKILLCREGEGERPYAVSRKIPFSGEAAYTGELREGAELCGACAWGSLVSCVANVSDTHLVCEAEVILCAEAQAQYSFGYLRDVYALSNVSETSSQRVHLRCPISCINGNVSINGTSPIDGAKLDTGVKVLDVRGVASPDVNIEFDGDQIEFSGKVRFSALTDNGSELAVHELDIPYKYTAELAGSARGAELCAHAIVNVCGCRARIDGEEMVVDAELYVAAAVAQKESIDAITEVRFGSIRRAPDGSPRPAARITVCYPSLGESLWSVAKRYGADFARVAADNGIDADAPDSEDSLASVSFLIV